MGWKRTDDLNGAEAVQRTFGLDGQAYTIDLGDENWERLQAALRPFLTVASPYGPLPKAPEGPSGREAAQQLVKVKVTAAAARNGNGHSNGAGNAVRVLTKRRAPMNGAPLSQVRAWAKGAGHDVPDKGRISDHILDLFDKEHKARS